MKRSQSVVGVFTSIALAVVMIGCGEKSDPVSEADDPGASPEVAVEPNPESGETREGAKDPKGEPDETELAGVLRELAAVKEDGVKPAPKPVVNSGTGEPAGTASETPIVPEPEPSTTASEEYEGDIGSESNPDAESAVARARLRAKQKKELAILIGLGKAFRVWSLDTGGKYPPAVDHAEFVEVLGRPDLLKFKNAVTGEVARPWYMKGVSAESSAAEILMASPWIYNGKRSVIFCDSSGQAIPEEEFQEKVARAIAKGGRELVK